MLENAEDMWGQTKNRKRIYPSKIFFTNPLLIIYTPLETSGSSPTGCFILRKIKGLEGFSL